MDIKITFQGFNDEEVRSLKNILNEWLSQPEVATSVSFEVIPADTDTKKLTLCGIGYVPHFNYLQNVITIFGEVEMKILEEN